MASTIPNCGILLGSCELRSRAKFGSKGGVSTLTQVCSFKFSQGISRRYLQKASIIVDRQIC